MGRRWLFSRTFAHGYNRHCVRFFFIFHRISIRFSSGFRLVFRFSQALLVAVVHTRFMCGVRIFFLRLYLFWMSFLFVFFSVDPTACLVLVVSLFAVACRRRMHSGPISRQCPIPQRISGLVPLFFLYFLSSLLLCACDKIAELLILRHIHNSRISTNDKKWVSIFR